MSHDLHVSVAVNLCQSFTCLSPSQPLTTSRLAASAQTQAFNFIALASGYRKTCTHVILFGPRFKTGRAKPCSPKRQTKTKKKNELSLACECIPFTIPTCVNLTANHTKSSIQREHATATETPTTTYHDNAHLDRGLTFTLCPRPRLSIHGRKSTTHTIAQSVHSCRCGLVTTTCVSSPRDWTGLSPLARTYSRTLRHPRCLAPSLGRRPTT